MKSILKEINESIFVKESVLKDQILLGNLQKTCNVVLEAYKNGNKTIFAGNGGSAADSQHLAAEFVSRFYFDRPGIPSLALTTDTSIITAIGNDYGYENLFSRQIEANAKKGDVFIAISTSGNSPNIIKAINTAKKKNIFVIGMTGNKKSKMVEICDICLQVPSSSTPRIQEAHILLGHIICGFVEDKLFSDEFKKK